MDLRVSLSGGRQVAPSLQRAQDLTRSEALCGLRSVLGYDSEDQEIEASPSLFSRLESKTAGLRGASLCASLTASPWTARLIKGKERCA